MFQAPTQTGGFCLICCALTYLRAAINGEKWSLDTPKPKSNMDNKRVSQKAPKN